jgi:hypothetical protein
MNKKTLTTGLAALLILGVAVTEFLVFGSTSALATNAADADVAIQAAPTHIVRPPRPTQTLSTPSATQTPNTCSDRTTILNPQHQYTVTPQPGVLGTFDVGCYNLLRVVAYNNGPGDVQLTMTILHTEAPALSTVLAAETLGSNAPSLTDVFELPGSQLEISAVTLGPANPTPSTVNILLYVHR